jgi:hypothetical protein
MSRKTQFNSTDTIFPLAAHEEVSDRGCRWLPFQKIKLNKTQKHENMEFSLSTHKHNHSGKSRVGFAFILAVALGLCVITKVRAQPLVVPNELATEEGNTPIVVPPGDATFRYMLIYDASQFKALSGPSFLTQFVFRHDATADDLGPRTTIFRLYASTTRRSVVGMSTNFNENIGTNNTLVFDGTGMLATENLPGPGNTRLFDIVTPLTTPFLYDPAAGNLVLDLHVASDSGQAIRYDAVTGNPTLRALASFGSATATSGDFATPQVTQFIFEAPPLVTIRTSQVEVCWNSQSNLTYQVQYRSDLTANLWTSLVNCIRSTNSTSCVYDPIVVGQPQRFYRVILTNCVP